MELKHLRSFSTLGETLHFGRAAARLNIVQPALSGHIKHLEEEIGVQLVDRSRNHVFMTLAGQNFLTEARRILSILDEAQKSTKHISAGTVGSIRLGFVSSIIPMFGGTLFRHFAERYPFIQFDLMEMNSVRQVEAIAEHRLDIGFVRLPLQHLEVDICSIGKEQFFAVLPAYHPLAKHASLIASDLSSETLLMLERENAPGFHDALLSSFYQNGLVPLEIKYFHEFTTAIHLASLAGLGVAIVPANATYTAPSEIVRIPLDLGETFSEIGMASHGKKTPLARNVCLLIERFVSEASPCGQGSKISLGM